MKNRDIPKFYNYIFKCLRIKLTRIIDEVIKLVSFNLLGQIRVVERLSNREKFRVALKLLKM
jgi:hypothetical protein